MTPNSYVLRNGGREATVKFSQSVSIDYTVTKARDPQGRGWGWDVSPTYSANNNYSQVVLYAGAELVAQGLGDPNNY